MIDQNLIESAKIIRNEFISLSSLLDKYQDDAKNLSDFFYKVVKELEDYNKNEVSNIKSNKDVEGVKIYLIGKMSELEVESIKLTSKIDPINKKIENLKRDELQLYEAIKKKYPDLSDDDMKKEIHSKL
jgi:hypothetical protein